MEAKQKKNEVPVEAQVNGNRKIEDDRNGNGKKDEVQMMRNKPCFQDTPLKVQIEVLKYLHWKDVLRIRRVCFLFSFCRINNVYSIQWLGMQVME